MTAHELIRLLENHPADMRVVVNGYEAGYDDLSPQQISVRSIRLNTGKADWEGCHGDVDDPPSESPDNSPVVDALIFRRTSY